MTCDRSVVFFHQLNWLHGVTEILLKEALNTITLTLFPLHYIYWTTITRSPARKRPVWNLVLKHSDMPLPWIRYRTDNNWLHGVTEILLKEALNTITLTLFPLHYIHIQTNHSYHLPSSTGYQSYSVEFSHLHEKDRFETSFSNIRICRYHGYVIALIICYHGYLISNYCKLWTWIRYHKTKFILCSVLCFVCLCLVSNLRNVASFSGLYILYCSFAFLCLLLMGIMLVLLCLTPFSTIFQLHRGVNLIGGRKPPTCRKSLVNFIIYCFIEYISPL
jgi:uncharacterized membrane protein